MEAAHIRKKFKKESDESEPKSHTVLHLAALLCNVTEVTELLDEGHDVDAAVSSGMSEGSTALHVATQFEHTKVIKVLLERGADFTLENVDGDTPLHIACRQNFTAIVKLYFTALCTACSRLNEGIAEVLARTKLPLDKSIHISERCLDRFKLLKFALQFQLLELIEILVNHGIDLEARDSNGMSALHYLVRELSGCGGTNFNHEVRTLRGALGEFTKKRKVGFYNRSNFKIITKMFMNLYQDTKNPLDDYGRSPLSYLYEGLVDQTDMSLSRMALFSADTRRTHASMYSAREHLIRRLLLVPSIAASLPAADREGNTILHLAAAAYPSFRAEQEAVSVVAAYLASGGDVDARNRAGSTALHRSCIRRGGTPVTEVLLQHGADVNAADAAGATAYSLAREWQPFWGFGCMSLLSYLRRLAVLGAALCPRNRRLWERDEGIARLAVPRARATIAHCTAEQCSGELRRMAAERVDAFATVRDLLDGRPHDLLHRTRNEKLAATDFFMEYPIYGYMLRNKMNAARWRAPLVQKAKETLATIHKFDLLPEDCLYEILSHFDIAQLKVLTKD